MSNSDFHSSYSNNNNNNNNYYNNDQTQSRNTSNNPFMQDPNQQFQGQQPQYHQQQYQDQNQNQHQQAQQHYASPDSAPGPWAQSQQWQDPSLAGITSPPLPPRGASSSTGVDPQQQLRRADTFDESDFVPEHERALQREVLQAYETESGAGAGRRVESSQADRDVAQLQSEFPRLDGAVVAAIYSDSPQLGAAREVLTELSGAV